MCLSIPGEVVAVDGNVATVDFWGVERDVRLETVDEPVEPGDYILNHVGFAIKRIPPEEAKETIEMYDAILASEDGDIQREDVLDELRSAPTREPEANQGEPATAEDADDLLDELGIEV